MLVATLWTGSLITVGYVVAPTLFATLSDRALAGTIAGTLFRTEAWLSLTCALIMALMLSAKKASVGAQRGRLLRIILAMAACTLIGYFGLQPMMANLRAAGAANGVMTADSRTMFGVLHGIAAVIFFAQSLLGLGLLLTIKRLDMR